MITENKRKAAQIEFRIICKSPERLEQKKGHGLQQVIRGLHLQLSCDLLGAYHHYRWGIVVVFG